MSEIIDRVITTISQSGLSGVAEKLRARVVDVLFDVRYGLDTDASDDLTTLTISGANREHARAYQATRVFSLRAIFPRLKAEAQAESVFVDLGCGKGRVLLVAAEFGFKTVRGVEFASELCETAKRNCTIYAAKRRLDTTFTITCTDAAEYPIAADEDVYFMFNPFDDVVMHRVLDNIAASCRLHPRPLLILYHMVPGNNIMAIRRELRQVWKISNATGEYMLYTNVANRG